MSDYTNEFKLQVLDDADRIGNLSKTAEKHGITRQTIYNWRDQEDEIRESVARDDAVVSLREQGLIERDVLGDIRKYKDLLDSVGDLETRKQLLAAKAEALLFDLVDLIENNPELDKMSPDRQSKVMKEVNDVKKDLYNEPTQIIEYRNTWMERVLQVLQEFLSDAEIREFASKMQQVEQAEFEEL